MSSKKKLFAIIASVAMLAGMLAFSVVPGVAATSATVSVTNTPNISVNEESTAGALGTISVSNLGLTAGTAGTDYFTVSLPGGVALNATTLTVTAPLYLPGTTTPNAFNSAYGGNAAATTNLVSATVSGSTVSFSVYSNETLGASLGAVNITLPYTTLTGVSSGAINAIVSDSVGGVSQTIGVGAVVSAGTVATVLNTVTMAPGSNSGNDVTVELQENSVNSLENTGYVKFKLPSYFTWDGNPTVTVSGGWHGTVAATGAAPTAAGTVTMNAANGNRELDLYFYTGGNTAVGTLEVTGEVTAAYNAPTGEVDLAVGGTNSGVTGQSLNIGSCGNYSVTTTNGTGSVILGQAGQTLPTFTLSEGVAGTLINQRNIELTLPSGIYWDTADLPTITVLQGSTTIAQPDQTSVSSDGSTLTLQITNTSSGTASQLQFSQGEVDVNTSAVTGPLTVAVSGSGINTTVQAGTVNPSVTVASADSTLPSMVIGQQSQAGSNFTITESASGNFEQNDLYILAPTGVTFSGTPTASVTAGNLSIGTAMVTGYNNGLNNEIQIPVTTTSSGSTPAAITVAGISLNLDNSVPAGPVSLEIGGPALIDAQSTSNATQSSDVTQLLNFGVTGNYVATIAVGNVTNSVTTTGSTTTSGSGSADFTVGATVYSVNNTQYVMDVAPYISNGRTFVPVRYLANALGATTTWDAATQTVTLTLGSNTETMTIGSTTMTVNGTATTMDVAPVIVNGRTMLPARWVAQGFGAQVGWNPATQVVLITW